MAGCVARPAAAGTVRQTLRSVSRRHLWRGSAAIVAQYIDERRRSLAISERLDEAGAVDDTRPVSQLTVQIS